MSTKAAENPGICTSNLVKIFYPWKTGGGTGEKYTIMVTKTAENQGICASNVLKEISGNMPPLPHPPNAQKAIFFSNCAYNISTFCTFLPSSLVYF